MVERRLEQARDLQRLARNPDQFPAVGNACAEVLFLLVHAIYVVDREQFKTSVGLRLDDSLHDLLARYISHRLSSPVKEVALASLTASRSHPGVKDAQAAAFCLAATESVVKYLSISSGREQSRETFRDLCELFVNNIPDLGSTHEYAIRALAKMPIGKVVASELTEEDVINHARRRRSENVAASTVAQDITYIRGVFSAARETFNRSVSTDPVDRAKAALRKAGIIGQSKPRDRRPTREELQSLVDHFEKYERHKRTKIPMKDIMEFALWSARRIGEICELRWDDLDDKAENCKVHVRDARGNVRIHEFPLLGKARDIALRQKKKPGDPRIFPYHAKSVSAAYTRTKAKLGIENLRFHDLRREAAIRLYEIGYGVEQISKVTGRIDLNTLLRDIGARPPSTEDGAELAPALAAKGRT